MKCEKCGSGVSPFDMPEHLDYHFAQELEESMRTPGMRTVILPPASKRKRGGGGGEAGKKSAKKKKSSIDISNFFTRK